MVKKYIRMASYVLSFALIMLLLAWGIGQSKKIHDDRSTIEQLEERNSSTQRRLKCVKTGLNYISKESGRRSKIIRVLQSEIAELHEYSGGLEKENSKLREGNRELERIKREGSKGYNLVERATESINGRLNSIDEIIKEIEDTNMD